MLPKSTDLTSEDKICLQASSTSEGIPKNLEKSLKNEFYENEFEVNLIGKIDFDEVKFNIEKAEITVCCRILPI